VLLKHFGGIARIRKASAAEIGALPGIPMHLAQAIKKALET
jgi:excinuclease UvrABC nuclease subunit